MGTTVRRAKSADAGWWSDTQKIEAVQAYIMFGKMPSVEAVTGIPRNTLSNWKYSDWWKDLEAELRASDDIELSGKLKKVIDKSIDVLADRMNNGDYVYDQKTGELKRRPVSLRDAHTVAKDLITQRRVLDNKPVQATETSMEQTLLMLANKFEEFAKTIKRNEQVIEGEVIHAGSENSHPSEGPAGS